VGDNDIPGEELSDDALNYLGLLAYKRELAEDVKQEKDLPVQPPELDDDEAFRLAITHSEMKDLAKWETGPGSEVKGGKVCM
jgi:hypothetical protein